MKMRNCKSIAPQLCQICKGEFKPSKIKVIEYGNELYTFCKFCVCVAVITYAKDKELID